MQLTLRSAALNWNAPTFNIAFERNLIKNLVDPGYLRPQQYGNQLLSQSGLATILAGILRFCKQDCIKMPLVGQFCQIQKYRFVRPTVRPTSVLLK